MLLIYPPVAKSSEPPAGIARLSGALNQHRIDHAVLDANLEGQIFLMNSGRGHGNSVLDTWTRRAVRNFAKNVCALREWRTYYSIDRYRRAVTDVNRVLEKSIVAHDITVGLANYQHVKLSPLRSADLLKAAEMPELNPFYPYFQERLCNLIEIRKPRTIGISLTYLSQALSTFAMMGFLRREYPEITLVCGGGLITSWVTRAGWHNPFSGLIDHLVGGPGELALLTLAGIEANGPMHYTPNYDSMPLSQYFSPGLVLPYSGSSGCFWNRCSFCPERAEGNLYRPVSVKQVTADLGYLANRMNPAMIHLLDNSTSTGLMKALIDNPPGTPWYGFARIEHELADKYFCIELKRSGCVMLQLGVESGDQSVLNRMQKGIDLHTVSTALKKLKQVGIAAYVYLLFGTPEETLAGARKTLEFAVRHFAEIGFLNISLFNMPVGGNYAQAFKTGSFYEGDLSLYTDFEHPEGWDRKKVRQFIDAEFKRHPAIASILKREPPLFTSNHAPFFVME